MKPYGSLDWFVEEYNSVTDDPWGLTWRPSQFLRYATVLGMIQTISATIGSAVDIGCATGVFTDLLSRHLPKGCLLQGVDFVDPGN